MADHKRPDYDQDETLAFDRPEQFKALFEETRLQIVDLLSERAATISELAETLGKPKGTVGHHVSVLEDAGLIRVVRTRMVRAIEAKYYGRTARTFLLAPVADYDIDLAPDHFLTAAATEYPKPETLDRYDKKQFFSTLRHVRIPDDRIREWVERLGHLALEFVAEKRGGDTTYGLVIALYPTDRPHLPDLEEE